MASRRIAALAAGALIGAVALGTVALSRGESINALWFIAAALCIYAIAYRFYAAWITSKVRTRLLDGKGYSPNHIKVVTERGVVYMLGLVTPAEGQAAAQVVSETAGVQKVVTLFESITEITPAQ